MPGVKFRVKLRVFRRENLYTCSRLRRHRTCSPRPVSNDHSIARSVSPAVARPVWNTLPVDFHALLWEDEFSLEFILKNGKMRRRSIFLPPPLQPHPPTFPTGIRGMLIWSSRCTELMGPHQKASVKAYLLPVNRFLLFLASILLSPLTPSLLGWGTGTPIT